MMEVFPSFFVNLREHIIQIRVKEKPTRTNIILFPLILLALYYCGSAIFVTFLEDFASFTYQCKIYGNASAQMKIRWYKNIKMDFFTVS